MIHSDLSARKKASKATFGRTDRGAIGIDDFYITHKCNPLCKLLGLPRNPLYDPVKAGATAAGGGGAPMGMSTLASSVDTSLSTVVKTNHLAQRQVRAACLRGPGRQGGLSGVSQPKKRRRAHEHEHAGVVYGHQSVHGGQDQPFDAEAGTCGVGGDEGGLFRGYQSLGRGENKSPGAEAGDRP